MDLKLSKIELKCWTRRQKILCGFPPIWWVNRCCCRSWGDIFKFEASAAHKWWHLLFFMSAAVQTRWSKLCAGRLTHGCVTPPTHYLTNTISVAILISPFWTWLQHRLTSFIYSVHQNLEGFQTMRYPSSTVGASVATRNDSSVHGTRCSLWNRREDGEF